MPYRDTAIRAAQRVSGDGIAVYIRVAGFYDVDAILIAGHRVVTDGGGTVDLLKDSLALVIGRGVPFDEDVAVIRVDPNPIPIVVVDIVASDNQAGGGGPFRCVACVVELEVLVVRDLVVLDVIVNGLVAADTHVAVPKDVVALHHHVGHNICADVRTVVELDRI